MFKKWMPRVLVLLISVMVVWMGYTIYQLIQERDALSVELATQKRKFKVLQRKHAEEKAQVATLKRAKLALEGKVREAQQLVAAAEEEKEALEQRVAGMDAEYQKKTTRLEAQITSYVNALEKLKTNRDEYKAKLAETRQLVKERNEMIYELRAEKDHLTANLQERTSGLKRCEKHNVQLVKLAKELLVAYENKGVGKSLLVAEPFTKLKKVEVEKFVQRYLDRVEQDDLELIKQAK